jgi:hypothetical protein
LATEGLHDIDQSAFTDPVLADTEINKLVKAYCLPVGAEPMPTDMAELDVSKWKQVHQDPELMNLVEITVKAAS